MRNCKDKWLDQKQPALKQLPVAEEKGMSLKEYLASIGVGSFQEAVFQKSQELYKKNDLPEPVMKYNERFIGMSYEEAKAQGWRYGGALEDIEKDYPGLYWCHERKDFFKWKPFIEYYKYNNK